MEDIFPKKRHPRPLLPKTESIFPRISGKARPLNIFDFNKPLFPPKQKFNKDPAFSYIYGNDKERQSISSQDKFWIKTAGYINSAGNDYDFLEDDDSEYTENFFTAKAKEFDDKKMATQDDTDYYEYDEKSKNYKKVDLALKTRAVFDYIEKKTGKKIPSEIRQNVDNYHEKFISSPEVLKEEKQKYDRLYEKLRTIDFENSKKWREILQKDPFIAESLKKIGYELPPMKSKEKVEKGKTDKGKGKADKGGVVKLESQLPGTTNVPGESESEPSKSDLADSEKPLEISKFLKKREEDYPDLMTRAKKFPILKPYLALDIKELANKVYFLEHEYGEEDPKPFTDKGIPELSEEDKKKMYPSLKLDERDVPSLTLKQREKDFPELYERARKHFSRTFIRDNQNPIDLMKKVIEKEEKDSDDGKIDAFINAADKKLYEQAKKEMLASEIEQKKLAMSDIDENKQYSEENIFEMQDKLKKIVEYLGGKNILSKIEMLNINQYCYSVTGRDATQEQLKTSKDYIDALLKKTKDKDYVVSIMDKLTKFYKVTRKTQFRTPEVNYRTVKNEIDSFINTLQEQEF